MILQTFENLPINIEVEPFDTWSADHTLAGIIAPVLQQLLETTHGSPMMDNEDVPEELRTECEDGDGWWPRWEWALKEMIWAFEEHQKEFDYDFCIENIKIAEARSERIANGMRLFGKYYRGLWD